jgi:hypothetical protein
MTLNSNQNSVGAEDRAESPGEDRRVYARLPFRGSDFPVHLDNLRAQVRLKDLSCRGASCFSEMPLNVGEMVYLELDKNHCVAAEVVWTRRLGVGLRFVNALDTETVKKIHESEAKSHRLFSPDRKTA